MVDHVDMLNTVFNFWVSYQDNTCLVITKHFYLLKNICILLLKIKLYITEPYKIVEITFIVNILYTLTN